MRNYFAGSCWLSPRLIQNHLIAWIDEKEIAIRSPFFNKKSNILIDSGAFSAFTIGKKININEYASFIETFYNEWEDKVNSIYFINLDEIGNAKKSWENQTFLDKLGFKTIPVIHQWGFKEENLKRALDNYDFIAFGGMVGRKQKQHTIPWLNKCYSLIGEHYKKNKIMPKTHLLGVASPKILYRYPCFSCDSTAYMSVYRYGESSFLKLNKLPKGGKTRNRTPYKNEEKYTYNKKKDVELLIKVLEYEITHYKLQEKDITNYWKQKGIVYE
tara:strand:- start:157 stop:972 length:816 start_codon:yes stop_codon:yes gene_type:complete